MPCDDSSVHNLIAHQGNSKWYKNLCLSNLYLFKERLVNIQSRSVPVEPVAFYAYLSTHEAASSAIHHIIAFDKVITNVGNAYHPHTGTFIAPRSGLYIFTWTIAQWGTSYHVTELVVDNDNVNVIYMNPANLVVGSVTGTVVVHVNQGDDVFVRTGSGNNHGEIISNIDNRSTFAGVGYYIKINDIAG